MVSLYSLAKSRTTFECTVCLREENLDCDFLLEGYENYIVEQSGEKYMISEKFLTLAHEWHLERNAYLRLFEVEGYYSLFIKRLLEKYVPIIEIDSD